MANKVTNPMLKSEGKLYINGEQVLDARKVLIKVSINNTESKRLGDRTTSSRTVGYDISVEISQYKSNKFAIDIIKKYLDNGLTPKFKVQAMNNDKGSDFFRKYGNDTITVTGCVPTGDLNLVDLDASTTDYVEETITFKGSAIV
nr:MAG TPA: tail tube protein [Caudoviricetes sp.]